MSFWCHRLDQNNNKNIVRISALKVFIAYLGLPGSFLELPVGFLINDITYLLSPQEAPNSFQEAPRKLQMTPKRHFEINWPLDLSFIVKLLAEKRYNSYWTKICAYVLLKLTVIKFIVKATKIQSIFSILLYGQKRKHKWPISVQQNWE